MGPAYDELEKHYKENLIKLDFQHLKTFNKDKHFRNIPMLCGVCDRHFKKTKDLLQHFAAKVKNEAPTDGHHVILNDIVLNFVGKGQSQYLSLSFV